MELVRRNRRFCCRTILTRSTLKRGYRITYRKLRLLHYQFMMQLENGYGRFRWESKQRASIKGRPRAAYWDGRNDLGEQVSSGVYFYQLSTPSEHQIKRMVIVK